MNFQSKHVLESAELISLLSFAVWLPVVAAAPVTTNVPVSSQYYADLQKLEAMGYFKEILPGAKPYTRLTVAKLTLEAAETAKVKPTPKYLTAMIRQLESAFAEEIKLLHGDKAKTEIALKTVSVETAYYDADSASYAYNSPAHRITGVWQPFGQNRSGNRYGDGFNYSISAEISGSLGHSTAISLTPRIGYADAENNKVSLQEGYLKAKFGSIGVEAGKQALFWGQGKDASLILGNTGTPLTMLRVNLEEPESFDGFFKFLGKSSGQFFAARLENDRADRALANGNRTDYDRPALVGMRADFVPSANFTFGLSRVSMLGGKNHGLSSHDWGHWFFGDNADDSESDRWNDIAGIDFRYRFPALEIYGELYGEDQAGYLPSHTAQKLGFYLPRLSNDGSWDLNLEYTKTSNVWYSHSAFQNGWVYRNSILGDYMGPEADKYLLTLGHYLSAKQALTLNVLFMKMEQDVAAPQKVQEVSLSHKYRLQDNLSLVTQIGMAKISNAHFQKGNDDTTRFLSLSLNYTY